MTAARKPTYLMVIAALAFGVMWLTIRALPKLSEPAIDLVVLREAVLLAMTIGMLALVCKLRTIEPGLMGVRRPSLGTLGWGIICAVASVAVSAALVLTAMHFGVKQNAAVLASLASKPWWLLLLMSATAGISEEIVFRGIVQSHIEQASGSRWLGAAIALALFSLAHLTGWGWSQVLFAAFPGAVLTLFFIWKRDLGVVIIGHFLTDVIGLLAAAAQANTP